MTTQRALEILAQWDPAMPAPQTAQLLASGLPAPIDGETATALLEKFDRLAVDLAS